MDFHDHDTTTSLLHKLSSEQSYQNGSRPGVQSSSSIPPSAGINRYNTSTAVVGGGAMDGRGEVRGRQMQRGPAGSAGQRQHTGSSGAGREARSRSASHRAWH